MMIALRIAAVALALAASAPVIADDAVNLEQRIRYYNVRGNTQPGIANSLRRDAPPALGGFQGQARFQYTWHYESSQIEYPSEAAICQVHDARVDIEIVITLPRHPRIGEMSAELQQKWSTFATALEKHELNHATDFARIGREIPEALNGLIAACRDVDKVVDAKGMEYVAKGQEAADDYDYRTNHGETEGTVWPGL